MCFAHAAVTFCFRANSQPQWIAPRVPCTTALVSEGGAPRLRSTLAWQSNATNPTVRLQRCIQNAHAGSLCTPRP
eukprot:11627780-Alexandrium_andersonii.AAC.1